MIWWLLSQLMPYNIYQHELFIMGQSIMYAMVIVSSLDGPPYSWDPLV